MKQSFRNIAVIGTGVIGSGWIIRFLFNKKNVFVFDSNKKQEEFLLSEIKRVNPMLSKIYKKKINLKNQLVFCKSINEAVQNADLIQENVPEVEKFKIKIIKEISEASKKKCNNCF